MKNTRPNPRGIFAGMDEDSYQHLKKINWEGYLVLDDIHLNDPMKEFWNQIDNEKYDITPMGHWSGTGLVIFRKI